MRKDLGVFLEVNRSADYIDKILIVYVLKEIYNTKFRKVGSNPSHIPPYLHRPPNTHYHDLVRTTLRASCQGDLGGCGGLEGGSGVDSGLLAVTIMLWFLSQLEPNDSQLREELPLPSPNRPNTGMFLQSLLISRRKTAPISHSVRMGADGHVATATKGGAGEQ